MVVGHLRGVEDTLRFVQRLAANGADKVSVRCHSGELGLEETVHDGWALGVDVVGKVLRVNTRISSELMFVERLNEVERLLGREAELTVAVNLQAGQVVQLWRLFLALLLLHLRNGERLALNGLEGCFALFLLGELALGGREGGVTIDRCQHPVRLRLEVVNLFLTVDNERQRGCLDAPDAEHLTVLTILQRVEACAVHA